VLAVTIVCVFIANEENSEVAGVGVDEVIKNGKMAHLKKGFMYWIDTSDTHPCIGTAAMTSWKLHVKGMMGHSGVPQKAINPLYLGFEVISEMCDRIHEAFPAHPKEAVYGYQVPTNMKLTMVEHPPGAVNQIPGQATFRGDIRVTPFYKLEDVCAKMIEVANDVASKITTLPGKGPGMGYQVGETVASFDFTLDEGAYKAIACDVESAGFKAFNDATKEIIGESKPYSVCGSLPLVYELQQEGFDLQLAGYGLSAKYHGVNEYALLSSMGNGYRILQTLINKLNAL
jgi:acetylornithine deacetylase